MAPDALAEHPEPRASSGEDPAALDTMIGDVSHNRPIEAAAITSAHKALRRDEPAKAAYAGLLRDMQSWIGGRNYSP